MDNVELAKSIISLYFSGLLIVSFLYLAFYLLSIHAGSLITYQYPIGYVLLILSVGLFIPLMCGFIRAICKHYLQEEGDEISLNFWYYGMFFTLLYLTFRTILSYFPFPSVNLMITFTVLPFAFAVINQYL